MKSFRLFCALIVLIGVVFAVNRASAVVVLTTMPSSGGFVLLQNPAEQLAVLVDVPAGNPYRLNFFQTDSFSGLAGYTAQMDLYEATGTTRGTFVASLGSASAPGSTTGIITFTPGTPITLNAGQRYWFQLYPSAGEVGWTLGGTASGIFGAAGARVSIDGGANWFAHANLAYTLDATELLPPTASFTFAPTYLSVAFTDTSSNAPTSWAWDFGDGSPLSNAQNPSHTYAGNGTYNVCLVATNGIGSSTPSCQNVTVASAAPPVASFTFGATNLTATFTDTSSNAPMSWAWDFGDGNISAAQNPAHTYAANGTYNVCLIATNTDGSSAPSCQSVTVAAGVVVTPVVVVPTPTPAPPIYPLNTWNATAPERRAYAWGMPDDVLGYVLMWRGAWTRIAGTIPENLVNRGVLIAVDVQLSSGGVNFPNDEYQMICLQGEGLMFFMDARTSPRAVSQLTPTSEENGYTCGWIPAAGTVILTER